MAYGIEVKNSSGSTIIDSGTDSYQIIEMGILGGYPVPQDSLGFYGTVNPGYGFFQEQDLDPSAMVFYRPLKTDPYATVTIGNTTYPAIIIMIRGEHISNRQAGLISGENYWHGYSVIRWGYVSNTSTNRIKFADSSDVTVTEGDPLDYMSVEYCVAQKARTFDPPTTGYGMTLTDNSGNLTYSTEYPCARIRAARGTQTSSSNEALGTFYQASNYGEAMNIWVGGGLDTFYKYNRTFTNPQYRDEYWDRYLYYDYVNNRIRFGMYEDVDDPSPTNSSSLATGNNFSTHIKNEILGIMI